MKTANATKSALRSGIQLFVFCTLMLTHAGVAMAGNAVRDTSGYTEFAQELREYIPNNIILSLLSKLPSGGSIYGYDIGDLTTNDQPDLVLSLKNPKLRWNIVSIYFFTTQNSGFELVKVLTRKFFEDPFEVAFYIEGATCFLTGKVSDKHWQVDGYTIDAFVFRQVYRWENRPLPGGRYGIQVESDYRTMKTTEFIYKMETLSPVLKNRFFIVPAYAEDMRVPGDVPYVVSDTSAGMVLAGISNWSGPDDCALSVFARYDSTELTLSALVYDDVISGGKAGKLRDEVAFWLDCAGTQKMHIKEGAWVLRERFAPGTLGIVVAADSTRKFTQLGVLHTGFNKKQQADMERIRSSAVLLRSGATLIRCVVPRSLFASKVPNGEFGFAVSYDDVDRLEDVAWRSLLSTSEHFIAGEPFTYGRLRFMPETGNPFERDDFRIRPLLRELTNVGVIPR